MEHETGKYEPRENGSRYREPREYQSKTRRSRKRRSNKKYFFGVLLGVIIGALIAAVIINPFEKQDDGTAAVNATVDLSSSNGQEDQQSQEVQQSQIKLFEDRDRLVFEETEYSQEIFNTVTVQLIIEDETIKSQNLEWSIEDEAAEIEQDNNGGATLTLKKAGTFELFATDPTGLFAKCTVISYAPNEYMIEDVPFLTQNYSYPSGCESVSATMLLNYYNYDISADVFINGYLPMDYLRNSDDGMYVVGPDPYTAFIGSPYDVNSLGCYPPVIVEAYNKIFERYGTSNVAVDTTGQSLEQLIDKYIVQDKPVLVWSTMYLWEAFETDSWYVEGAGENSPYEDGDLYSWIANEHCLVLTGYDEYYYYFNDPLYYEATICYEKQAFEDKFETIGVCSVAIEGDVLDKALEIETPPEATE